MNLDIKKIQQLSSEKILELIQPTINKIYKIDITDENFYNLVLKEINDSKKKYKDDIPYIVYIKKKINIVLFDYINKSFLEPEKAIIIINNYINKNLKQCTTIEKVEKNFKELNEFFHTYNYVPTPDIMLAIIEQNEIFSKMIELIVNKYNYQIMSGEIDLYFNDEIMILAIEVYCMHNNIDINQFEENEEEITEDSEVTDFVKIYLKEIGAKKMLSKEEEQKILQKVAEGDSNARKILIEGNLKLVASVAKRYIGRGLLYLDLIQEGNLGLMKAIEKYDVSRGVKFSTYAIHWIRQAIFRAIELKGRNVRLPVHIHEKVRNYKKTIKDLEEKLNRNPTIKEIAEEMKLSESTVSKLHKLQIDTVSINLLIGDGDTELEHFIPSTEESTEDIAIANIFPYEVKQLLEKCDLSPREFELLILRYGLNGDEPMTLTELGKKFNLTRERVRQLEEKCLMKIRSSKNIRYFADYMQKPDEALKNLQFFKEKYYKTKQKRYMQQVTAKEKKRKENEEMSKLQTIYEYFKNYTKEEVDEVLTKLTEDEKKILTIRYGEDLNNPISRKLSKDEINKFYGCLIPKMKRLLSKPNKQIKTRKKRKKEIIANNEQHQLPKEQEIQSSTVNIQEQIEKTLEEPKNNNDINKEDYEKVLELLKSPMFNQMLDSLTIKEKVIISLKLGYIEGKCYSTEAISGFLDIESDEVIEVTRKVLLLFKENINKTIDNAIENMTKQSKTLVIK